MLFHILALFVLHSPAQASPTATSIVALDAMPGEIPLVYLSDGTVKEVPAGREDSIRRLLQQSEPDHSIFQSSDSETVYEADTLDESQMNRWFKSMNRRTRYRAQCYNRAHIWAFEANRDLGIRSEKVFMFFSSRYIREYHYRWWFHTAPLTRVKTAQGSEERVMDPGFFDRPVSLKAWSDDFIKPKTPCKTVSRYSEYASLPHTEYCYFMMAPMYMWQPKDLEAVDNGAPVKERFEEFDIQTAYRQAFWKSSTH